MTILRAEYVEILQKIASGTSSKNLTKSITEKGVEPEEVPKLLCMAKAVFPRHQYKLIASVILREGLKGDINELPVIAELAPKTLSAFRLIADYMTKTMRFDNSTHIRSMVSSNFTKRIWDRSVAEFLSKYQLNRICHQKLYKGLELLREEVKLSELELLQKAYQNIAKIGSGLSTHELASATISLHQKGHLDVIVEMLRLKAEDPSIEQLVQGARMPENVVDPGHWIWIHVMLQRLKEGKDLPNIKNFILANIRIGNMDNARIFYEVQQTKENEIWSSDWMSQIFKGWQAGV